MTFLPSKKIVFPLTLLLMVALPTWSWAALPAMYQSRLPEFDQPTPILTPVKREEIGEHRNQSKSIRISENGLNRRNLICG